jgi:hypothetical protein
MEADAIVGKILNALKELDFARDTIVAFASDDVLREVGDDGQSVSVREHAVAAL